MAHYAFLDDSNVVTEVITGIDETETIDGLSPEEWYAQFRGQKCVRTSYNGKIRYNYAGLGYSYDPIDDAFISPMPTCGHDELILTPQKQWECTECERLVREALTM
jgi:hypothetical protein